MKQNLDCLIQQEYSNITDLCLSGAMGDFQSGKVCKGYNDMTYCICDGYQKACGQSVAPLMCNMLQRDLQAQDDLDKCQWFDCSKPFPFNGTFV